MLAVNFAAIQYVERCKVKPEFTKFQTKNQRKMLKIVDIFVCHNAKLVKANDICNNILD